MKSKDSDIYKSYELQYTLTYLEAYEAFFILANKFGKKVRYFLSFIITLACVVMLYFQYRKPTAIQYTFLTIIGILILFQLIYMPIIKARKGASSVKKVSGDYHYCITGEGYIKTLMGEHIPLVGDKDARAYETDLIFVLRPDRLHTFCIPKRVLSKIKENDLRDILKIQYKKLKYIS